MIDASSNDRREPEALSETGAMPPPRRFVDPELLATRRKVAALESERAQVNGVVNDLMIRCWALEERVGEGDERLERAARSLEEAERLLEEACERVRMRNESLERDLAEVRERGFRAFSNDLRTLVRAFMRSTARRRAL